MKISSLMFAEKKTTKPNKKNPPSNITMRIPLQKTHEDINHSAFNVRSGCSAVNGTCTTHWVIQIGLNLNSIH